MIDQDLEQRLAAARADWPVPSVVDRVMAAVRESGAHRPRRGRSRASRLVAMLSGSGLLGLLALAWIVHSSAPSTVQAALADGLVGARSAFLSVTSRGPDGQDRSSRVWYVRGAGLRAESAGEILVDDGRHEWSWQPDAPPPVEVVRRPSSGVGVASRIIRLVNLPERPESLKRARAPELDRRIGDRACSAYILPGDAEPGPGLIPTDPNPARFAIWLDGDLRVVAIEAQRLEEGHWRSVSEARIDYDVEIPPQRVVFRQPEEARVVDAEAEFEDRHPLDRAVVRLERDGLILAVHEARPLEGGAGYYVVSSVRPVPRVLRDAPRRRINQDVELVDVAVQPFANRMVGDHFLVGLGESRRGGTQYVWWLLIPRRPDGPDAVAAGPKIPLTAHWLGERRRDAQGTPETIREEVAMASPGGVPPLSLEDVARRVRLDLLAMRHAATYAMFGVRPDAQAAPRMLRPLAHHEPGLTTDSEFAAAIRRGIDDLVAMAGAREP